LGGGVKEPGWLNPFPAGGRAWLRQYNFHNLAEVPQIIGKFLADPLTSAPVGAAAASQAARPPEKQR
jgi:hypothetical protein